MLRSHIVLPVLQGFCSTVHAIVDAVVPSRCAFCGTPRRHGETLVCSGCDADLPRPRYQCTGCAQILSTPITMGAVCSDCQSRPTPFAAIAVPFEYEFPLDAAIRRYKFRRRLWYAPAFAELLLPAFNVLPETIDALLPVPLHWLRHGGRGFNQATEICRVLRKRVDLPMLGNVVRQRATPYQSASNSRARRRNLKQAFSIRGTIDAKHVLIVDDVVTTGETCRQLAKLLIAHDVEKVSVLAIARARKK
jgi:ComF family protein